jgi:hypothetical protein
MAKVLGIVLVLVGLVMAAVAVTRMDRNDARTGVEAAPAAESTGALTEVALPLAAALAFASGIVLLVVGVGNWNHPRRHSAPGDAVVDPEAHDKMDHV